MKNIEQLRVLFREARELAKEASPAKSPEAARLLSGISEHCKELYKIAGSYLERAQCRNMYESIDNVCDILNKSGFFNKTVMGFFGLLDSEVSFGSIVDGRATIRAEEPELSNEPKPKPEPSASKRSELVAPPPPKKEAISDEEGEKKAEANGDIKALMDEPSDGRETLMAPPPPKSEPETEPAKKQSGDSGAGASTAPHDKMDVETLDGFIGQEDIIRRLRIALDAARKRGEKHLDNILLFGNKGLGKSTLMRLIAKELGVEYFSIDCTSLMNDVRSQRSFQNFFVNIAQSGRPVVVALDEIHALPGRLQSGLLTLLETGVYSYLTDGVPKNVPFPEFTFIAATTDYDAVLSTLKDRCTYMTFFMKDYTRDELRRIILSKLSGLGLTIDDEALEATVNRCRGSIRDVVAMCKGFDDLTTNKASKHITLEVARDNFRSFGLDEIGLTYTEGRIIKAIFEDPRGVVAEETLAARVGVELKQFKEHESYLMKIGFLSITSRGRALTTKAEDYIRYGFYDFGEGVTIGENPYAEPEAPEEHKAPEEPENPDIPDIPDIPEIPEIPEITEIPEDPNN